LKNEGSYICLSVYVLLHVISLSCYVKSIILATSMSDFSHNPQK